MEETKELNNMEDTENDILNELRPLMVLPTLKDLNSNGLIDYNELRKTAIEHIKALRNQRKKYLTRVKVTSFERDVLGFDGSIIYWIKNFFNIDEKEIQ